MEQIVQTEPGPTIPDDMYQLAEKHRVGQPLALYHMHPKALRTLKWAGRIMLITLIGSLFVFLIGLASFSFTLYHLLFLGDQNSSLQNQLIEDFLPLMLGFIYGIGTLVMIRMLARGLPASILACTEGLLLVRPKSVDVTYWHEVKHFYQIPGMTKRKNYYLIRINRRRLSLGESFENIEELVDLIKQRINPLPVRSSQTDVRQRL